MTTTLKITPYLEQAPTWPQSGRHIMAQFDAATIVVYQAYRPAIARFAVEHQRFCGEFSFSRMSWIKPNFLWMMYRSGWASKEGQEHVLAVRLKRSFFDEILEASVASSFSVSRYESHEKWQEAVAQSDVRLQWDPDHDPNGKCLERRAVQLGLRGETLRRYGQSDLVSIEDVTLLATEQRENLKEGFQALQTPCEEIYRPHSATAALAIGIDL